MSYYPKHILVFDFETVSLSPYTEPHEIGAILLSRETLEPLFEFDYYFKINEPEKAEQAALNVSGVKIEEINARTKTFKDALTELLKEIQKVCPLKDVRFSAWNAAFDYNILKRGIYDNDLLKYWNDFDHHTIDLWLLHDIYRKMLGLNDNLYGIKQALKELDFEDDANNFSHRALEDCRKEVKIIQKIYKSLNGE